MARTKWNKVELKVFIVRNFDNQKAFSLEAGVGYNTYRAWIAKDVYLPRVEEKMLKLIEKKGYPVDRIIEVVK